MDSETSPKELHPMKRLLASSLILSVFSLTGFVGCGEEPKPADKPAASPEAGKPAPAPAPTPGPAETPKETPKAP
jgi:hypothetical protein